jgi:D-arabinose 1-dehydrogenase-like Zn-dependent alcohol dehydrogenase
MSEEALAAVMIKPNEDFELKYFKIPEPEPNAIIAEITAATVCGTDVHIWRGRRSVPLPIIIGHEGVGKVHSIGCNVKTDSLGLNLTDGDKILWSIILTCGRCYGCIIEKDQVTCKNRKIYGYMSCQEFPHLNGTFSTHIYLRPNTVIFKVPDNIPDELLSTLNCAGAVAYHSFEKADMQLGMTAVIQGSGPISLYLTSLLKEIDVKVIVIGGNPIRLETLRAFGADYIIDRTKYKTPEERITQVKELTDGIGADRVFELTGHPSVIPEGISMLRRGGKYMLVGTASENIETIEINPSMITLNAIHLIGVRAYEPKHLLRILKHFYEKKKKYPFDKIITQEFELKDVKKAILMYETGKLIKAAIIPK